MKKGHPDPRRTSQQLRNRLALAALSVIMVLAFTSVGAQATGRARIASACPNETVTVLELKPVAVTLRFVLHGVSCTKAHSLIRTYFRHEATPRYCRNRGNICAFVAGGWTCSLPLYTGEGGGDFAACIRENPFAQVKVFKVARHTIAPANPRCVAQQLRVSLGTFSAETGRIGGPIRFRNHGNLCSLRGYPDVDGLAADGRVGERARHILTGFLGGATHIATVTVAHDQTASAFLQGYDCAFFTPPPRGYRNLKITAPGTTRSVRLMLRYPLCGLEISPIVPGRSGLS